jgi:L-aspartate semialdehyde sulfurtransferase ferredoxin
MNAPMSSRSRLHLSFPEPLVERPVIYEAANRFGVVPNIRRANVETHTGWVILELSGDKQAIEDAVSWFSEVGVIVNRMEGDVLES